MRAEMEIRNKKDNRLMKNLKLSQRRHYATSLVTIVLGDFNNPAIYIEYPARGHAHDFKPLGLGMQI